MHKTIAEGITAQLGSFSLHGDLLHDPDQQALFLGEPNGELEVLSINLSSQGDFASETTVFVKDWSEHSGLAASLIEAGVAELVREVRVGPFRSRAYELRVVLGAEIAPQQHLLAAA